MFSPTLLTPCEIWSLAQSCVITTKQTRAKTQPAPKLKAIITSKDINAAANTLSEDLVIPCDKTPGMVQILCPRLGWFLLQTTYPWEGDKKSCTLIGHATTALVAEKLQCIRKSYPSTHIAPLKTDGTMATA